MIFFNAAFFVTIDGSNEYDAAKKLVAASKTLFAKVAMYYHYGVYVFPF